MLLIQESRAHRASHEREVPAKQAVGFSGEETSRFN